MLKITDSVYSVGALNPNLRVFDIVMKTDFGTSYNSYLVKGEKTALIETCHDTFWGEFLENLEEVCEPSKIDYVILNHTEPDHSGALHRLLKLAPNAQIICSQAAGIYLKNITNQANLNLRVVKHGETLDLGAGRVLSFINAPFLHWPDSMFTWLPSEKVLFSCDFFGSHYCEPRMLDIHINYRDKYELALKGYFDAIFGPFKPYVLSGLQKLQGLDIEYCAASHGPVLTKTGLLPSVMKAYEAWAQPQSKEQRLIPLFYCSAYGNTGRLAGAIAEGIASVLPEAQIPVVDLVEADMTKAAALLNSADGFLVGSPTINRDAVPPIWILLAHVDAINSQKKPASAFGSFGWSGEAVPSMLQRLGQLKYNVVGEGFRTVFVPSQEDLKNAREYGAQFAKSFS